MAGLVVGLFTDEPVVTFVFDPEQDGINNKAMKDTTVQIASLLSRRDDLILKNPLPCCA